MKKTKYRYAIAYFFIITNWCLGQSPLVSKLNLIDSATLNNTGDPIKVNYLARYFLHGSDDFSQPEPAGTGFMIRKSGASVYETNFEYTGAPQYRQKGTYNYQDADYNRHGSLIYWRPVYIAGINDLTSRTSVFTYERFLINPDNTFEQKGRHTHVENYLSGDTDGMFSNIVTAMGLGFSDQVVKGYLVSSINGEGGLRTATFKTDNTTKGRAKGSWEMDIEEDAGLVRRATFQLAANGVDSTMVDTSGTLTGSGLKIAKNGIIKHSADDRGEHFTFTEISKKNEHNTAMQNLKKKVAGIAEKADLENQ